VKDRAGLVEADRLLARQRFHRLGVLARFQRLQRPVVGRVLELQLHIEAQAHQRQRQQEGDAPAPLDERIGRNRRAHDQHDEVGQHHAGRHAHLGEAAVEAAAVFRRVLDGEQRCAAPLAADREALGEPQHDQQQGRGHANRLVGGQ